MTEPTEDTYIPPPHGWCCFHCGEIFSIQTCGSQDNAVEAAQLHFGVDPEWKPGCIDPLTKDENERREYLVGLFNELEGERARSEELEIDSDNLKAMEAEIERRLKKGGTLHAVWMEIDSIEGRALAAEAIVARIREIDPKIVDAATEYVCRPKGAPA